MQTLTFLNLFKNSIVILKLKINFCLLKIYEKQINIFIPAGVFMVLK